MRRILLLSIALLLGFQAKAEELFVVPDGFRLQALDPTNGRIAMPEGWFYKSSGTPSGWLWTFSKEDPNAGPYETGLRIQLLAGVRKGTGKSPKEFAQGFLEKKRASAKFISECAPQEQGELVRQCLEVVEQFSLKGSTRPYRVSYSVFWSRDGDMVIVNTFGTPDELWEMSSHAAEVMSHVEVIGPGSGR